MRWGMGAIGALLATGVVALSVVSFSGAATAQTPVPGGDDLRTRHQELLAQKLGISVDKLTEAQKAVRDQLIDEAVAAGKLTADQAAKLKAGEPGELRGIFREKLGEKRGDLRDGVKAIVTNVFEAAAKVIGVDESQLKQDLSSGKSLVDIAGAKGISRDQLKAGMTTELKADIAAALAAGTIDQTMADRLTQALDRRIDAVIDGKMGEGLRGGGELHRVPRPMQDGGARPVPDGMGNRFFQRAP